jgi:hypothetical protein
MIDDPIVEEVRDIRAQIAAQFAYDVLALGAYYRQLQQDNSLPVISRQTAPAATEAAVHADPADDLMPLSKVA